MSPYKKELAWKLQLIEKADLILIESKFILMHAHCAGEEKTRAPKKLINNL